MAVVGLVGVLLSTSTAAVPMAAQVVAAPTPTSVAQLWLPPLALLGVWERRDALLIIADSGLARLAWRTDWCGPEVPAPCDTQTDNTITFGARADLRFVGAASRTPLRVQGRVTRSNMVGPLAPGPIELTWVESDLVQL